MARGDAHGPQLLLQERAALPRHAVQMAHHLHLLKFASAEEVATPDSVLIPHLDREAKGTPLPPGVKVIDVGRRRFMQLHQSQKGDSGLSSVHVGNKANNLDYFMKTTSSYDMTLQRAMKRQREVFVVPTMRRSSRRRRNRSSR